MKITVDENGYVVNYAMVGDIVGSIEVPDLSGDELAAFTLCYEAYKLVGCALIRDGEKALELEREKQLDQLRHIRRRECFPYVNRGKLWYDTLTAEQMAALNTWYRAWLDVTETSIVPAKPEWLD